MKREVLLTFLLAVFALVSSAAADSGARPFRTSITFTQEVTPTPEMMAYCWENGERFPFAATRSGQATHLGRIAATEWGCLDFADFPLLHSEVWGELIAANGDMLYFHAWVDVPLTDPIPEFQNGTWVFEGGSGRFEGATGSGTVTSTNVNGYPGWIIHMVGVVGW